MMASTDTREGAQTTLDALELGALDFVHKPDRALDCRGDEFTNNFLRTLNAVVNSNPPVFTKVFSREDSQNTKKIVELVKKKGVANAGKQIVAIASSTGGPKSLQSVIPRLPENLDAPVVLVQHMPTGFTKSMAERLDSLSSVHVKEAQEGEEVKKGEFYVVFKVTEENFLKGVPVIWQGAKVTVYEDGSFGMTPFDASGLEDHTLPPPEDIEIDLPDINPNEMYTAEQILDMQKQCYATIKEQTAKLKLAES